MIRNNQKAVNCGQFLLFLFRHGSQVELVQMSFKVEFSKHLGKCLEAFSSDFARFFQV